MTPETLFDLCNQGVLPAWLLLLLAPGWRGTQAIVQAIWIPLLLGVAYGIAIVQGFSGGPEGGGFGSLEGVMLLFTDKWAVCGGWIHYLVFDLFVGAWEVRDARRRDFSHVWIAPCLVLTLMLGPLGLLTYLAIRWGLTREIALEEGEALAPV